MDAASNKAQLKKHRIIAGYTKKQRELHNMIIALVQWLRGHWMSDTNKNDKFLLSGMETLRKYYAKKVGTPKGKITVFRTTPTPRGFDGKNMSMMPVSSWAATKENALDFADNQYGLIPDKRKTKDNTWIVAEYSPKKKEIVCIVHEFVEMFAKDKALQKLADYTEVLNYLKVYAYQKEVILKTPKVIKIKIAARLKQRKIRGNPSKASHTMEILITMIKRGDPKPSAASKDAKIRLLGKRFHSYCFVNAKYNNVLFQDYMRRLGEEYNNNWFAYGDTYNAQENMEKLIEMVKCGEPRPKVSDSNPELAALARRLHNYLTRPTWYKEEIFEDILYRLGKEYNNNWFAYSYSMDAQGKKEKIIEMLISGQQKPTKNPPLYDYISPSSKMYDRIFTKKLLQLSQKHGGNWFDRSNAIWDSKKYDLSLRIRDKDKLNNRDVMRLNRCLLNPDDPYYDYAWYRNWGALAKELMTEQNIPVKIY